MRNILVASTAVLAFSASAFAADLPSRAAPAALAPAPIFTWTGFFAGANAGFIDSKTASTDLDDAWAAGETIHNSGSGVLGGVQAGYNLQTGALVFGLETDIAATSADPKGTTHGNRVESGRTSALGTVRGRVGLAYDHTLFYVTGGLAYADVSNSISNGAVTASTSGWRTGWTLGGGVETAIAPHWTVKVEGLYYNLGTANAQFTEISTPYAFKTKNDGALARVGVNYKF